MQPEIPKKITDVPFPQGTWSFENQNVVDNFQSIADANIPNYRTVIQKCVQIAKRSLRPDSHIVDVGCARGATLEALFQNGFTNLTGIDCSEAMIAKSFAKARLVVSQTFPSALTEVDMVLANWTLHFIAKRDQYLKDIYRSLRENGTLVLTEKIAVGSELKDLYHEFKKQSGMSEADIRMKENSIRGVLVPYSLTWYLETLQAIGFREISIVDAHFSFVTFYAKK